MIYAIGDIHGQHTMLLALLDRLFRLPVDPDDLLLFIGDYVDRGENSCAVIETLLALSERHPHIVFLRGNHEQLMIDALEEARTGVGRAENGQPERTLNWLMNGGGETIHSYPVGSTPHWWEAIPESHREFLRATQMEHVTERYHFVHAGLLPPHHRCRWEEAHGDIDPRLWIREPFLSTTADFGGRIVVFGHTPQKSGRPFLRSNKIGIDTGAVYGGPLTAAVFDTSSRSAEPPAPRFIQVPHIRTAVKTTPPRTA